MGLLVGEAVTAGPAAGDSVRTPVDSNEWLENQENAYAYSSSGSRWRKGQLRPTKFPSFAEGDTLHLTLDIGAGVLHLGINDRDPFEAFGNINLT